MRKYFLLLSLSLTLIISLIFSSISYANWIKIDVDPIGHTHYIDIGRIKYLDNHIYVWTLIDYLKRDNEGFFSMVTYMQIKCELPKFKLLDISFYRRPMGKGIGKHYNTSDMKWQYPPPNSMVERSIKIACK